MVENISKEEAEEILEKAKDFVHKIRTFVHKIRTGKEEEVLRHLARTLQARHISFLGFVPPSELAMLRATAEAVVVPSIWYENSPLSALEAMGEGVPVLASSIGGLAHLQEIYLSHSSSTPRAKCWRVMIHDACTTFPAAHARVCNLGTTTLPQIAPWQCCTNPRTREF